MSDSNCCFLTCIQISQDAGKVVCYSHLLKNFPQFVVIHTVKGFGVINKAEVDVFLELSVSMIQWMLAVWSLVPLPFLKPARTSGSSCFTYFWTLDWRILSITLLVGSGVRFWRHEWKISPHIKLRSIPKCGSLAYEKEKQGDWNEWACEVEEKSIKWCPSVVRWGEENVSIRRDHCVECCWWVK